MNRCSTNSVTHREPVKLLGVELDFTTVITFSIPLICKQQAYFSVFGMYYIRYT
jgi:hypothetical protein